MMAVRFNSGRYIKKIIATHCERGRFDILRCGTGKTDKDCDPSLSVSGYATSNGSH